MKTEKNKIIGLILIAIGVVVGLYSFNIIRFNIFFKGWWTLIIIIPSIIGIINDKNKTANIISLCIGIFLYLAVNKIIDLNLISKLIIPTILILVGLSLFLRDTNSKETKKKISKMKKNKTEYCTTFSVQEFVIEETSFSGCTIDSIFGETKLDLTKTTMSKDSIITNSSIFGKTQIILPQNTNVEIKTTNIFGEVKNKVKNDEGNKVTLYIDSLCLFGGIEIK